MRTKLFIVTALFAGLSLASWGADTKPILKDARLDKKVTYEARGIPLRTVLEQLSEKTGVTMRSGVNQKDWRVRDRKLIVFVKDMPLRDLQQTIATLMRFTWERTQSKGVYSYRIVQDIKSRKEEEALGIDGPAGRAKKRAENRQKMVDTLDKLGSMTPEDLKKLKKDDPFLYMLQKEQVGTSVAEILRAVPEARDALAQGKAFQLKLSEVPESVQASAGAAIRGWDNLEKRLSFGGVADDSQDGEHSAIESNISQATLRINPTADMMDSMGGDEMGFGMLGMIFFDISPTDDKSPHAMAVIPFMDSSSGIGKLMERYADRIDSGQSPQQIQKEMEADSTDIMAAMFGGGEPDEPLADCPELAKKVKIEVIATGKNKMGMPSPEPGPDGQNGSGIPSQADIMAALFKESDLQFISDQFPSPFDFAGSQVTKEGTVGDILKSIGALYGKRLKKTDSVVTFEDRKWAEKRGWQVPDDLLNRWIALGKKGKLSFDDLVEMANLTDPQIDHGLTAEESLMMMAFSLSQDRYILRFYSLLSGAQKNMLGMLDGLSIAGLPAEQQAAFDKAISKYQSSGSMMFGGVGDKKPEEIRPDSKLVMRFSSDDENRFYTFLLEDTSTIDNTPDEPEAWVDTSEEPATGDDAAPPTEIESIPEPQEPVDEPSEEMIEMQESHYLQIANWMIHVPGPDEFEPPKFPTPGADEVPEPPEPGAEVPPEPEGK